MKSIDTNFRTSYTRHVERLSKTNDRHQAFQKAIGGDFEAVGKLEYFLLKSLGLAEDSLVVDMGCGSGRLAVQLAKHPRIRYYGYDIVPELIEYAREITQRTDWKIEISNGHDIPMGDSQADFVCMFSVITHLLHEDSFKYFKEAFRVLAPGGKFVVSFLEFAVPSHWTVFLQSVESNVEGRHLNQFVSRDAIEVWAKHVGFNVDSIRRGDEFHIPISEEIVFDSGDRQGTLGTFGQSVAVLVKD